MIYSPTPDDYSCLAQTVYQKYTQCINGKIMLLIRGFPGMGKSTLAEVIYKLFSEMEISCRVFEADIFFHKNFDPSQEYIYDVNLLQRAHLHCQLHVTQAIVEKVNIVIVSNTLVKERDFYFYLNFAHSLKYNVIAIDLHSLYKVVNNRNHNELTLSDLLAYCATKNEHGVSLETLNHMARKEYLEIDDVISFYDIVL